MLQVEIVMRHLLTIVGKMFRRVATAFGIVFVVVAGAVEGLAYVFTQAVPTGLTHVVAIALGFSMGLTVSLAVAIEEGLRGFIKLIEEVVKATEVAAKKIGEEIIHEGGQLVQGVEHEAQSLVHGAGHLTQGIERGAATAVRDVVQAPGHIIQGAEHLAQGVEQRITGHHGDQ